MLEAGEPIYAWHYSKRSGNRVRRINAVLQHPDPKLPWMLGDASRATLVTGCITWKKAKDSVALDIPRLLKEKPYLKVRYSTTKTGSRRFLLA